MAVACVVGRSLALVARPGRIRSCLEQDSGQVGKAGGCCLVQGGIASGLRHVDIRAVGQQESNCLGIPAQGYTGMQRLVLQRVARELAHLRAVVEQQSCRSRSAKGSGQVKRSPTVS
jgi:hypothetical protein